MKLFSWLWQLQPDAPKWPYILCAAIALLFGLNLFVAKGFAILGLVTLFVVVCWMQVRQPTILGWALIIAPFLAAAILMANRTGRGDLFEYFLFLLAAFIPVALLIFFRPRIAGFARIIAVVVLCACGAIGFIRAKHHADYLYSRLGPSRGYLIEGTIPVMRDTDAHTFLSQEFRVVHKVRDLPPSIRDYYTEQGGDRPTMANPGKDFQETDVVSDPSLPFLRLIFAGTASNRVFLHYESGGFGHGYAVRFFELSQEGQISQEWKASCEGPALDLAELRKDLAAKTCDVGHYKGF